MRPIARDIPKHDFLYEAIKEGIRSFKTRTGFNPIPHIADALDIRGNAQPQLHRLFDLFSDRYLRADELLLIIQTLGEDASVILEAIALEYGYTLSKKELDSVENAPFENRLLSLNTFLGKLSEEYLASITDGEFSREEMKRQLRLLRLLRLNVDVYIQSLHDSMKEEF